MHTPIINKCLIRILNDYQQPMCKLHQSAYLRSEHKTLFLLPAHTHDLQFVSTEPMHRGSIYTETPQDWENVLKSSISDCE